MVWIGMDSLSSRHPSHVILWRKPLPLHTNNSSLLAAKLGNTRKTMVVWNWCIMINESVISWNYMVFGQWIQSNCHIDTVTQNHIWHRKPKHYLSLELHRKPKMICIFYSLNAEKSYQVISPAIVTIAISTNLMAGTPFWISIWW